MSKHPLHVAGFDGTLEDLAKGVGALRYDAAAQFFKHLEDEYKRQSDADGKRGYRQLSEMLDNFAKQFAVLHFSMTRVWKLCEPRMREEAPP